jgi:hypothetical protein
MYADDDQLDKQLRSTMFSLSGTGFFGAIGRSINLGKHNFVPRVYLFSQGNPSILKTN